VIEDTATGLAYINVDGVDYELGLDFLTMAMVYNTSVPEGGMWETEDDVYATWWKLYIQRWNYLLPEVPLYSNEYYDLYNAQIKGVTEYPTNPFWAPANALIDWTSEKDDGSIILGSSTELSGKFRYATFAANSPGSSDLDVQNLIVGLETVATTKEGGYKWNPTVVAAHDETDNADGTRTYTIKLHDDLKFSDGSPVTAKNYVAFTLVFSTPVAAQAAGKDHMSGMNFVGFDAFNAYDGTNAAEDGSVSKEFKGIRLLDELTFSVTVDPAYLPYFYSVIYGSFSAQYLPLWLGEFDIMDDGNGVYLSDGFYAKDGDSFAHAAHIEASAWDKTDAYPYSGPYCVESYNEADKSATLVKNEFFKGNYEGTVPQIGKVVYKKIVTDTQIADFESGNLDVIAGITGGNETNEAITLADNSNGKYVYSHYSRAGYGKLGFRGDFGPVQFVEVRQAIAYCMDRATFAKDFTGGFGGVVDGPYYTGSWMYKAAVADGMMLDAYATSADSAIAVLEQGGWVYNADGSDYAGTGVRYKKIAAAEIQPQDITFQSKDGAYKTEKVGDDYYMPLVLNWYGTSNNEFTDLLVTGFMENENIKAAGFVVQNTIGEFNPMLDELYQQPIYGFYAGTPLYTCFNFATGFTSAVYDYSYNWEIEPTMFDNYSICYIKDLADAYWLQ
jgi:ABC-type transport system substrate-binding protein